MQIQAASLASYEHSVNVMTPQCVTQEELDYQIDYMIKELEGIRKTARKLWI